MLVFGLGGRTSPGFLGRAHLRFIPLGLAFRGVDIFVPGKSVTRMLPRQIPDTLAQPPFARKPEFPRSAGESGVTGTEPGNFSLHIQIAFSAVERTAEKASMYCFHVPLKLLKKIR